MGAVYATVADIRAVGYPLTAGQETSAETLLEQASVKLRLKAQKVGKDIDAMIADATIGEDYAVAVKSVVVQAVCRGLDSLFSTGSGAASSVSLWGLTPFSRRFSMPDKACIFCGTNSKN